jgi:hypothetical protein
MFRPVLQLLLALFIGQNCAHATSDGAGMKSLYFTVSSGFNGGKSDYASRWAGWLKLHRAIESLPTLKKELQRRPAFGGSNPDAAFLRLRQQIPAKLLRSQPSHVYVVQIGHYRSAKDLARFVEHQWPRTGVKAIYAGMPKSCYFWPLTEFDLKSEPLFVLPGSPPRSLKLCYGMYASTADARSDAARLDSSLSVKTRVLRRPLTAALAGAFGLDDINGSIKPMGGSDKIISSWKWF